MATRVLFLSDGAESVEKAGESYRSLEYDFYRDSYPHAESTIRAIVRHLHKSRSVVAPALLRLVFHDCFIEGCDASILLDDAEGIDSEKKSPPNESLKGFEVIDIIKEELEELYPGVVSCSDILALATREGVVLAGCPFYPLYTGRRDSMLAFADIATFELPSPNADLSKTLASFSSRGFDLRETVTPLGNILGTSQPWHNRGANGSSQKRFSVEKSFGKDGLHGTLPSSCLEDSESQQGGTSGGSFVRPFVPSQSKGSDVNYPEHFLSDSNLCITVDQLKKENHELRKREEGRRASRRKGQG